MTKRDLNVSTGAAEKLVGLAVERFVQSEMRGRHSNHNRVSLRMAAIGTVADRFARGSALEARLKSAGLEVEDVAVFKDADQLTEDVAWDLAVILSPYKQEVGARCASLSPAARKAGVVDTILRMDGAMIGLNTNSYAGGAVVLHISGNQPPSRVLVCGTGASARSLVIGILSVFSQCEIGVVGRTSARARELAQDIQDVVVIEDIGGFAPDFIINATTVGESHDQTMLDIDIWDVLRPGVRFFDLNNRYSDLQKRAVSSGCIVSSGILMQEITNTLRVAAVVG